jgi:hypothetical protein
MDCSPGSVGNDAQLRDTPEPCHAPEWRWPAFFEIKVYSRHPVMAVDYEVLGLASDGRHCLMIFCLGQHFSWSVS